jgi:hypothetical protein
MRRCAPLRISSPAVRGFVLFAIDAAVAFAGGVSRLTSEMLRSCTSIWSCGQRKFGSSDRYCAGMGTSLLPSPLRDTGLRSSISMAQHPSQCINAADMSTCDSPVHGDAVNYSRLSQWQNIDLNVSKPLRLTSLLSAPSAM